MHLVLIKILVYIFFNSQITIFYFTKLGPSNNPDMLKNNLPLLTSNCMLPNQVGSMGCNSNNVSLLPSNCMLSNQVGSMGYNSIYGMQQNNHIQVSSIFFLYNTGSLLMICL